MMYITEIEVNGRVYAWPKIKALSFVDAESKCPYGFIVVWKLILTQNEYEEKKILFT